MTPEFEPMNSALETAMNEIREESVDPALVEAAAGRVWAHLLEELHEQPAHIRTCADFQALIPEMRAGRLAEMRVTLLKDHLHECVACRKVYEGKVVSMPAPQMARRQGHPVRWAAAAVVVIAAGASYMYFDQYGAHSGRAYVQALNGTLYQLTPEGTLRPLAIGQDLPDGVEIRTAKDSNAMLELRDGSVVELRERSGFSTNSSASDLTVHLGHGSIIVQAAKRRTGHLYVATADCRVAVTGTLFSVSAGLKGSRVSVIEGEVHVAQDNQDKVLHPGDQAVTSATIDTLPIRDDIAWSRNRDRLQQQLTDLRISLQQIHLPALRYQSSLLDRLPADTVMFASIPNLGQYLGEAQAAFQRNLEQSPELRDFVGKGNRLESVMETVRAGNQFLGDEVVVVGRAENGGSMQAPVFLAEARKEGFPEFLKKQVPMFTAVTRGTLVVFGPEPAAVESMSASLDQPGFKGTPYYERIAAAYREGAGILLSADFSHVAARQPMAGVSYFLGQQKEVRNQMETRASVAFTDPNSGIVSWLADPAPMGSLDYVSPDATLVTAFVVRNPAAIVDQVLSTLQRSPMAAQKTLADAHQQTGVDVRADLAASLGGEFSLSMDGPVIPVPSWKLVTEVYDPARMQSTLQRVVAGYNQDQVKDGKKPLRTAEETVEGHVYYTIASPDGNPLLEAHYTFANGYMIAAPSRALVSKALQLKTTGTSITHSSQFLALEPQDRFNNFSALVYQNLGTTLAPLAGLIGAFAPQGGMGGRGQEALKRLGDMKPMLLAGYRDADGITVAGTGNVFGTGLSGLLSGNLTSAVSNALPFGR